MKSFAGNVKHPVKTPSDVSPLSFLKLQEINMGYFPPDEMVKFDYDTKMHLFKYDKDLKKGCKTYKQFATKLYQRLRYKNNSALYYKMVKLQTRLRVKDAKLRTKLKELANIDQQALPSDGYADTSPVILANIDHFVKPKEKFGEIKRIRPARGSKKLANISQQPLETPQNQEKSAKTPVEAGKVADGQAGGQKQPLKKVVVNKKAEAKGKTKPPPKEPAYLPEPTGLQDPLAFMNEVVDLANKKVAQEIVKDDPGGGMSFEDVFGGADDILNSL
jgi:hypothetical protein